MRALPIIAFACFLSAASALADDPAPAAPANVEKPAAVTEKVPATAEKAPAKEEKTPVKEDEMKKLQEDLAKALQERNNAQCGTLQANLLTFDLLKQRADAEFKQLGCQVPQQPQQQE